MSLVYGLLVSFYIVICLFLALIILVQKSKSSMGLGGLGGGSQMLFGSSGGQDLFQKITWVLGGIFMGLSLLLALMKSREAHTFKYIREQRTVATSVAPEPVQVPAPEPTAVPSEPTTKTNEQ